MPSARTDERKAEIERLRAALVLARDVLSGLKVGSTGKIARENAVAAIDRALAPRLDGKPLIFTGGFPGTRKR